MPHGASDAHNTTITSGFSRSWRLLIFFGFPGSTAISIWFFANRAGSAVTWPPDFRVSMFFVSADANTSASAPPWICWASVVELPGLSLISVPGWASWKSFAKAVNAGVSEEAMNTWIEPERPPLAPPSFELLPQATSPTASTSANPARVVVVRPAGMRGPPAQ